MPSCHQVRVAKWSEVPVSLVRFPNEVFFFIKVLESIGIELSYSTDEAFEGAQGILKASMGITDYQGGRMGHLWCI